MTIKNQDIQSKDGNEITVHLAGTLAQTAANYGIFFIANRPIEIMKIKEVHTVAGNDAGAVTLQLDKKRMKITNNREIYG